MDSGLAATDLGFTRDRHSKEPKSAKADLGAAPRNDNRPSMHRLGPGLTAAIGQRKQVAIEWLALVLQQPVQEMRGALALQRPGPHLLDGGLVQRHAVRCRCDHGDADPDIGLAAE